MSQASDASPFRLFDTDGDAVAQITTDGATIKPFLNAIRQVVEECRIHFADDGLRVTAVDPANVFMIDAHLPASAIEEYDRPDGDAEIGVNVASFRYAIRRARMGSDDTLTLRAHERRLYAQVTREYDGDGRLVTEDHIDLIDPDSVRTEPDIPELDLVELDVSRAAFVDATEHADASFSDHIEYTSVDGDLHVSAKGDKAASKAVLEGVAPEDADGNGLYSAEYVEASLTAIRKAKADELAVALGESSPIRFDFERTNDDGETTLSGEMLLAPRVKSDSRTGDSE